MPEFHINDFPLGSNKKQELKLTNTPAGLKPGYETKTILNTQTTSTTEPEKLVSIPTEAAEHAREDLNEQWRHTG